MSGFSPSQLKKLTGKLDRSHVHSRSLDGRQIDYIEGWFALSEANAIFGFANWDRETVHFERLFERTRGEMTICAYSARVRIRVRAGDHCVLREGTGCGTASARNAADAHERAIKAAETDATKRALATFGNRFGLCLYDKDQAGVSEPASRALEILCPDGQVFAAGLSPEGFCTALRKIIESTTDSAELAIWQERNAPAINRLRTVAPDLKTQNGKHYADVLERLFFARLKAPADSSLAEVSGTEQASVSPVATAATNRTKTEGPDGDSLAPVSALVGAAKADEMDSQAKLVGSPDVTMAPAATMAKTSEIGQGPLVPLAPSRIALGPRIDKAALAFKSARRLRDKAHLRRVAALACLICGRQPSHAHHVRYAQPHGLSQKVSDEFVVPLCFLHHRALHDAGSERDWWHKAGLDPLPISARMWAESHIEPSGLSGDSRQAVSEDPTATSALP